VAARRGAIVDCPGTRRAGNPGSPYTRAGELGRPLARFERIVRGLVGGCKRPLLPHLAQVRVNILYWEIDRRSAYSSSLSLGSESDSASKAGWSDLEGAR